jgi:hypothetical protein
LEKFRRDLIAHRNLWSKSLDEHLPEYPITNRKSLESQADSLFRQLGLLRPYMEELHSTWILGHKMSGVTWNILDTAISLQSVAQMKGPSLSNLIEITQAMLGRLDDFENDQEFRTGDFQTVNSDVELAERICSRVRQTCRVLSSRGRGKKGLLVKDEYDVQDILHAILRAYFKYTVVENPISKLAASRSTRADLSIKELSLIVEVKFVRSPTDQKRIEQEIAEDLVFYTAWEPLKYLFFVIFGADDLQNAELLDSFSKPHTIGDKSFSALVICI